MRSTISIPITGRSLIMSATVVLAVAGCGGGSSETVRGTVTLNGSPLPAAYLMLVPMEKQENVKGPFIGKTDEQGRFSIGPIDDSRGGVPPGNYRLSITTAHSEDAGLEDAVMPPERVPANARLRDFQVPDGGVHDLKLDLTSK